MSRSKVRAASVVATLVCTIASPAGAPAASGASPSSAPVKEPSTYPLEGTRWRLVAHDSGDGLRPVAVAMVATLQLRNGRARGRTGCLGFRARYVLAAGPDAGPAASPSTTAASPSPAALAPSSAQAGEPPDPAATSVDGWAAIGFDHLGIDDGACEEESLDVGSSVVDGLASVTTYGIDPGEAAWQAELTFRDEAETEVLVFRVDDAGSLRAGRWLLASIAGAPIDPSPDGSAAAEGGPILAFDPRSGGGDAGESSGRVTGSTGCNSFSGGYTVQGGRLTIERLQVSDLACGVALEAQDAAILAVLSEPSLLIELPPGRLTITAPGRPTGLEYVTSAPLEGRTWLLTGLRGRRIDPGDVVTLRLDGGQVGGEAPCGPYTGTYATNGVLVSVSSLAGASEACPLSPLERAYRHALRRAVFLALEGPTLVLRDAGGRTVARFLQPGSP